MSEKIEVKDIRTDGGTQARAAECGYQEALTKIRFQNTHVRALVESIELLDERQTGLMELAADVYQKDEPAEIVQVWRAFKEVIKAVHK